MAGADEVETTRVVALRHSGNVDHCPSNISKVGTNGAKKNGHAIIGQRDGGEVQPHHRDDRATGWEGGETPSQTIGNAMEGRCSKPITE